MNTPVTLKEKFQRLMTDTTSFFVSEESSYDRDRELIDRVHTAALDLAEEARHAPQSFERLVSYLLGLSSFDSHYPLHAIQMMCLAAHLVHGTELTDQEFADLATAAFFADFGFRAAWLSYQSEHAGSAVYHLRELSYPWWTLAVERSILFHHEPASDPSPHRALSITAQYLAILLGMGTEKVPEDLMSPGKAMQTLMEDERFSPETRKRFLDRLSSYSLGSWIRLNNGEIGLVIANRPGNPLRPVVGVYKAGQAFGLLKAMPECQEIDLKKEISIMVAGEALPRPQDRALFDHVELWVPRWNKNVLDPVEEEIPEPFVAAAEAPMETVIVPISAAPDLQPIVELPSMPVIASFTNAPPVLDPPAVAAPAPPVQTIRMPEKAPPPAAVPPVVEPETMATWTPEPIPESLLTPSEQRALTKEVVGEIEKTLESCEVRLHQLSHRCDMEAASLPKAMKPLRHAIPEIRSLAERISAAGDPDVSSVLGVLSIWEGDLLRAESMLREARSAMATYLLPWETKKKEARGLLENLQSRREEDLAQSNALRLLVRRWRDSLHPEMEELAAQLAHDWDQRAQQLHSMREGIQEKAASGTRVKQLMLEKMAMTCFAKGIELRRQGAWSEAIASFEKVLAINPQFWEAHTYIGLCHFDASDRSHIAPKRPPRNFQDF